MPKLLKAHTTLHLGGPAGTWIEATEEAVLIEAASGVGGSDLFVLGGGSNVVVAEEGFKGAVVQVLTRGIERDREGDEVILRVQAGEQWDELVTFAIGEGLAGIECMSGIPGTVGAAPMQNISAYGQALKGVLQEVKVLDRLQGQVLTMTREECQLGYRDSRLKREPNRFVVLSVELKLVEQQRSMPILHKEVAKLLGLPLKATAPLAEVQEAVLRLRRKKGMVYDENDTDTHSTGSFFVNPLLKSAQVKDLEARIAGLSLDPTEEMEDWGRVDGLLKVPAAWLIEKAGFSPGCGNPEGVAISSKHTLALANHGDGSTNELVALARRIVRRVGYVWGIELHPEPEFIGHRWTPLGPVALANREGSGGMPRVPQTTPGP